MTSNRNNNLFFPSSATQPPSASSTLGPVALRPCLSASLPFRMILTPIITWDFSIVNRPSTENDDEVG